MHEKKYAEWNDACYLVQLAKQKRSAELYRHFSSLKTILDFRFWTLDL